VHVDTDRRDDITIIDCPEEYVGYITGHRGSELRSVEDRTGTFCFMDGADVSGDVGGAWWAAGRRGGGGRSSSSWHRRDDDEYGYHHHSRHSKENPPRLLILCFDPLRRDDAEEMIRDRIEERVRQDIERSIRVPSNFDNKHSNEEVEARREEKWGPRPPQQPEKDNNDKDDVEGAGGERDASPRSVSPEGGSRERSHHSKRWSSSSSRRSRSHSASADRKRSRSKDDDDTEEREEEDSHRKDPSPARDDKHSSREVDERSNSRSSAKRRRSLRWEMDNWGQIAAEVSMIMRRTRERLRGVEVAVVQGHAVVIIITIGRRILVTRHLVRDRQGLIITIIIAVEYQLVLITASDWQSFLPILSRALVKCVKCAHGK
ncbi:hypothetical protein FOZ62_027955, partial [Perkinsus olseni]